MQLYVSITLRQNQHCNAVFAESRQGNQLGRNAHTSKFGMNAHMMDDSASSVVSGQNDTNQISDAILSVCLRNDPESRVAVEALIKDRHRSRWSRSPCFIAAKSMTGFAPAPVCPVPRDRAGILFPRRFFLLPQEPHQTPDAFLYSL